MSEHAIVVFLGIAFTAAFLGGLLELTRLPEVEPERQHEEKVKGRHEEEVKGRHEEEVKGQKEETRHEPGYVEATTFTRRFFGDVLLEALLVILTLVVGWLVWLFFAAKTAQTPAKRLLNVYIVDSDTGQPVAAGRVWVREVLVKILLFDIAGSYTLGIALLVNHAWPLFDDKRQALHDKIVSTAVVYVPNGLPQRWK